MTKFNVSSNGRALTFGLILILIIFIILHGYINSKDQDHLQKKLSECKTLLKDKK